jgi:hypothetical protein
LSPAESKKVNLATLQNRLKDYSYGFNGMEMDDEVTGDKGTSYTAEYWQYDPRVARRWNVDPVVKHGASPYVTYSNSPIYMLDVKGLDSLIVHRSAATTTVLDKVNIYDISISIVQNGQEYLLPYKFQQSDNAKFIQMPKNATLDMEFKAMGAGAGDPDYDNTIFVESGKRKANGEQYYTFMHPGAYGASYLKGCMITASDILPNGAPDIGDGQYYGADDYLEKANAASVEPLDVLKDLYIEYGIGDENGVYEGNAFQMKTNSVARDNYEIIKLAPKKLLPLSTNDKLPKLEPPTE